MTDKELIQTIFEMKRVWRIQIQSDFTKHSATILQYEALSFIQKNKQTTVKEVAVYLALSMSSTTQLIERLVISNFVLREQDTEDRRIVHVSITESGMKELILMQSKVQEKLIKILNTISREELEEYLRVQKKIVDTLHTLK